MHIPTDIERQKKLKLVYNAWLRENRRDVPALVFQRLLHFATTSGADGLTTVPRWSSRALDFCLFEKSRITNALMLTGALLAIITLGGRHGTRRLGYLASHNRRVRSR